jgi:hypothetical protein
MLWRQLFGVLFGRLLSVCDCVLVCVCVVCVRVCVCVWLVKMWCLRMPLYINPSTCAWIFLATCNHGREPRGWGFVARIGRLHNWFTYTGGVKTGYSQKIDTRSKYRLSAYKWEEEYISVRWYYYYCDPCSVVMHDDAFSVSRRACE